jgi:hypothetical protein
MHIRFGTFDEALGRRAAHAEWTFVACVGSPEGASCRPSHRLSDHLEASEAPPALRRALAEQYDAAWVRGRLPRVFGYEPADPEVEKTLLHETFAAVRGDEAVIFSCADHYGRTALIFSDAGPDQATKGSIAAAFWGLLLQDADDLANYRLRIFHPGACVWLEYASEDGEVSLTEFDE